MHALSGAEILEVWDLGEGQPAVQRALLLLGSACPEYSAAELAALRIGQRDALLFALREQQYGTTLRSYGECPACTRRVEFALSTTDIKMIAPLDTPQEISVGDYHLQFRFPDSEDLLIVAGHRDLARCVRMLFERCVVRATHHGEDVAPAELPQALQDRYNAEIGRRDPQAEVRLELACSSCGHKWDLVFDIATFLWREIAAQGGRLLHEIDALARAYGWTESEVLALSPRRRQRYLEIGGG